MSRDHSIEWQFIINPAAGGGKGLKKWTKLSASLPSLDIRSNIHFTERPGHAIQLVRDLIEAGQTYFVACGGDGTANEVANGILQQNHRPTDEITLAFLGLGTGNDWPKSHGIPAGPMEQLQLLKEGISSRQHTGLATFMTEEGPSTRYFINNFGIGADAHIGQKIIDLKAKGVAGSLVYPIGLLKGIWSYTPQVVTYSSDAFHTSAPTLLVAGGFGKYYGGGMKPCPNGSFTSGKMEVSLVPKMPILKLLLKIPSFYNGRFTMLKEVQNGFTTTFSAEGPSGIFIHTDGEIPGHLPAKFEVSPKILQVIVPDTKS